MWPLGMPSFFYKFALLSLITPLKYLIIKYNFLMLKQDRHRYF